MKEKIKEFFNNEKNKKIFIFVCILLLIIFLVSISIMLINNSEKDTNDEVITTTTKKKNIFKGYIIYDVDYSMDISYDYQNKYEFKYASSDNKDMIYSLNSDQELYYELSLKDGVVTFTEEKYKNNTYTPTGKKYETNSNINFKSYIVATTCQLDDYSIVLMDDKNNIYKFESSNVDDLTITNIIDNIEIVKTSVNAQKVGYYDLSNEPGYECNDYELIYLDINNVVRKLDDNNSKFFESAYYRYIGSKEYETNIYVLKDGLMKYGNNNKYLNDGNYNIYYRGSFYTINNEIEDIYVISKDGYLYKISNVNNNNSSNVIKRYTNSKIKKIGTRVVRNEKYFVTDKYSLAIEFEDESNLTLDTILEFELLK